MGIGSLYIRDSASVDKALDLERFLTGYCRAHKKYPDQDIVSARFPELRTENEWYYWLSETGESATFQYPMLLPLPSAPGQSKVSAFIPIVYAYVVRHPCRRMP